MALAGKSFVVTTGTGSGKSHCYFVPIVDAVVKARRAGERARTRALVIYPMNALANSQQEELRKFLGDTHGSSAVTFARYTGQEGQDERERIKQNPPDILLTNFMMLELRLRARIGDPDRPPVCIGTSATMASEGDQDDRNQVVADVASKLFGTTISRDAVVTETLKRGTDPNRSADRRLRDLGTAVDSAATGSPYLGLRNSEIADDPLAIWIETRLGLANVDSKPIRARPRSFEEAAQALAEESARPLDQAQAALKSALLALSLREKDRGVPNGLDEPLFAFKLHQFISGAGRLYATIDAAGHRTLTFDGQIFDPDHPENRLFATHFCRNCGQEHHPVMLHEAGGTPRFEKREIDDVPVNEDEDPDGPGGRWGFLMPEPDGQFDFQGRDEDYPDAWLEETKSGQKLKATYRKSRAELLSVRPNGSCEAGARRAWFMPGRFKFCPACGEHHSDSTRGNNRLASLSAERPELGDNDHHRCYPALDEWR